MKRKRELTQEEFIRRCIERFGNDIFDFSETVYVNSKTKVKVKCKKCGYVWEVLPYALLRSKGCKKCTIKRNSDKRKMSLEEFIKEATEVHKGKYDYSKVIYVNCDTPITVICPEHGEFQTTPYRHLRRKEGCPKCGIEKIRQKLSMTKEEFIQKAQKIYGNKYDYSLVEYKNNKTKVKIICPKHGIFEQTPNRHLSGQGCPKCALEERSKRQTMTREQFIEKAKKVHGNKYDYSLVEYEKAHSKVKIICPKHGIFEQLAYMHLQGNGCPKCAIERIKEKEKIGKEKFIEKAKRIHGNKYDYSLVKYVNKDTKVKIICKNCNRIFLQTPHNHLTGYGCPHCNKGGIDFTKPSFLYYIRIEHNNKDFYKIGITNKKDIYNRFKPEDQKKIKVIRVWKFENGYEALKEEQKILKEYKDFLYNGNEKILISNGNTEIFVKDILNSDREGGYYHDIRAHTA